MRDPKKMSELIRAKKKKMMQDPDVIDSGDSPSEDLQDLEIARQNETTMALDKNTPKEHSEGHDESNATESAEEAKEQKNHDGENASERDDEAEILRHVKRKSRIKSYMSK